MKLSFPCAWALLASSALANPVDAPLLTTGAHTLTVSEAAALIRRAPGTAPPSAEAPEALGAWLSNVLVPHFVRGIYAAKLAQGLPSSKTVEATLLARAVEDDLRRATTLSSDAIQRYYDAHASVFTHPAAVRVSRILVRQEADANEVLKRLRAQPDGLKQWGALTREFSLDTATKLRDGDLGFIREGGATDVPQVRVAAALFTSVHALRDGELLTHPVRENDYFAVVWRRASRAASIESLAQVSDTIRAILERDAVRSARVSLLGALRAQSVSEYHPELLESVNYAPDPGLAISKSPLAPHPAGFPGKPSRDDRGDR